MRKWAALPIKCTTKTAISALLGAGLYLSAAAAAETCNTNAMVVFDGSGSMAEMGHNRLDAPRIFEARDAMRKVVPRVAPFRNLGLIVYGPGDGPACDAVDLRFAPIPDAGDRMVAEIDALQPTGETPLTKAIARAAEVLDGAGTVVVVTDGQDTCGGAPCQLAAELAAGGMVTVHVIGFKLRGKHFAFPGGSGESEFQNGITVARCLADQTGGTYVSAQTVGQLIGALQETLGCPVYGALR